MVIAMLILTRRLLRQVDSKRSLNFHTGTTNEFPLDLPVRFCKIKALRVRSVVLKTSAGYLIQLPHLRIVNSLWPLTFTLACSNLCGMIRSEALGAAKTILSGIALI